MTPRVPPLTPNAWLRYEWIRTELDRVAGPGGGLGDVLEIGAGQGGVGTRLALRSSYTGIDLDPVSLGVAKERVAAAGVSARLLQGYPDDELGRDERFDWVCAFEVLEHIRDDREVLASWIARLRPGGHLLLSVPAFHDRYSNADRLAGHFRRYDPPTLDALLHDVGLVDVSVRCYGVPLGYALEWGRNTIARRRGYPATPEGQEGADTLAIADGRDPELVVSDLQEATLGSARFLQPGQALGPAIRLATWPFRKGQKRITSRGTGLIATGRVPA